MHYARPLFYQLQVGGCFLTELENHICDYLRTELISSEHMFDNHTELFKAGFLDYMNLIHLMLFIEENFNFKVSPLDLSYDNFGSVHSICEYIDKNKS